MKHPKKLTELQQLQAVWTQKLKESGFEDIEDRSGRLTRGITRAVAWVDPELREITQEYYCMAYHFLNSYNFETTLDKVMWEYHVEGIVIRDIAKLLTASLPHPISKTKVGKTIKDLENIMKSMYLSA